MAMNIVTSVTSDDQSRSLSDLRRLKTSLDRQRVLNSFNDPADFKFYVISDYDKEVIAEALKDCGQYKLIHFTREEGESVKDPSFYQSFAFNNYYFGEHDKVVYIDARCYARGLIATLIYSSLCEAGEADHTSFTLTPEQTKVMLNNGTHMAMFRDWSDLGDTDHYHFAYMFNYGENKNLLAKMEDESMLEYDTFMHFLEGECTEEKGVVISEFQIGSAGPLYINDEDANEELVVKFEENVRPHFPAQWRGHQQEEMSARYLSFGHEYRTHSNQTSLMYFVGSEDPSTDRWAELWILGY